MLASHMFIPRYARARRYRALWCPGRTSRAAVLLAATFAHFFRWSHAAAELACRSAARTLRFGACSRAAR